MTLERSVPLKVKIEGRKAYKDISAALHALKVSSFSGIVTRGATATLMFDDRATPEDIRIVSDAAKDFEGMVEQESALPSLDDLTAELDALRQRIDMITDVIKELRKQG